MTVQKIIAAIDQQIAALTKAKAIMTGGVVKRGLGRPKGSGSAIKAKMKRNMTPEGRARIAATVKARWARQKKAGK